MFSNTLSALFSTIISLKPCRQSCMNESVEADHKIVSKGEESMTSKWERVETEGLGRAMRERQSRGGGRDNVEKNQAEDTCKVWR